MSHIWKKMGPLMDSRNEYVTIESSHGLLILCEKRTDIGDPEKGEPGGIFIEPVKAGELDQIYPDEFRDGEAPE